MLPVVGVEDHVLLITFKSYLDPVYPSLQSFSDITLRLLDLLPAM